MDLQHHLVRREQDVHPAGRAVRRGEQFERFVGEAPPGAAKAASREDFRAALLAEAALAVERAALRHAAGVRGDADRRVKEAIALQHVAAAARHEPVRRVTHVDERLPVDDARIVPGLLRLLLQQLVPLAPRRQRFGNGRRGVVALRRGPRQRAGIVERVARRRACPRGGALEDASDAFGGRVGGGRIPIAAIGVDRGHHSAVGDNGKGLRNVLAHGERLARLLDEAQRPEVGVEAHGRERVVERGHRVGRLEDRRLARGARRPARDYRLVPPSSVVALTIAGPAGQTDCPSPRGEERMSGGACLPRDTVGKGRS